MLSNAIKEHGTDIGLLILRVTFGALMAIGHGWGKFGAWAEKAQSFPDPLGLGSPISMALAIGAELFCAVLIVVGLGTRFVAIPLIITMGVAVLIIHGGDSLGDREMALLYLGAFASIALMGPGKYSADAMIQQRRS